MTIPTDANDTIVYTLLQESVSAMFNTSAIEVQWRSISQLTGSLIFARIIAGNEVPPLATAETASKADDFCKRLRSHRLFRYLSRRRPVKLWRAMRFERVSPQDFCAMVDHTLLVEEAE